MGKLFTPLKHGLIPPTNTEVASKAISNESVTENSDVYRFGGDKYSFNAHSSKYPSDIVPQQPGNYPYPRD